MDKSYPSGFKSSCKSCTCELARKRRAVEGTKRPQWDKLAEQVTIFIYKLFHEYDCRRQLEIPVRVVGHPAPLPLGCFIRPDEDCNRLMIRGRLGYAQYCFEMIGPQDLAGILKGYGLEVILPSERVAKASKT